MLNLMNCINIDTTLTLYQRSAGEATDKLILSNDDTDFTENRIPNGQYTYMHIYKYSEIEKKIKMSNVV